MKNLNLDKILKQPRYLVKTDVRIEINIVLETVADTVVNNFLIDNCTISLCKPVTVDNCFTILAIQFTDIKQDDQSFFSKTDLTIEKPEHSLAKLSVNIRLADSRSSYSVILCTVLNPFVLRFCTSDAIDEACFILGSKEKNYCPSISQNQAGEKNLVDPKNTFFSLLFETLPSKLWLFIPLVLSFFGASAYNSTLASLMGSH